MSSSSIGASRACSSCSTRARSRVFVAMLMALLAALASMPLHARSAAAEDASTLLIEDDALQAAAAECGIGIAGERFEPVTAAAMPASVVGVGKWVGGLLAGHIKGVVTRRLGMDQEYNRFLALSRQLRQIESQLQALDQRFDQLSDQLRVAELRKLSADLAREYVNPVRNGTHALEALACDEAAALNAARMGGNVERARTDLAGALADFRAECRHSRFANIPSDLTAHFKSDESILDRYLEVAIESRRYLTHQDARDLDDFFFRYHLIQIQALRLAAECELRFPARGIDADDPNLNDSVADRVYLRHNSHARRAQIEALPNILPEILAEGLVFDARTRMLWWNGEDYGVHPAVNRNRLVPDHTIAPHHDVASAGGTRRFELAPFNDVQTFAALGAGMPLARRRGGAQDRYPATLKPFLVEIGLDKVAARIPDTGNLSYVWTSDTARPIRRCFNSNPDYCTRWYDPHDALGHNAVIAPADRTALRSSSGNVWHVPQQCAPGHCVDGANRRPGVISLCRDPRRSDRNVCIADAVLGMWQAPGIYRSTPQPGDRFFAFDVSAIE